MTNPLVKIAFHPFQKEESPSSWRPAWLAPSPALVAVGGEGGGPAGGESVDPTPSPGTVAPASPAGRPWRAEVAGWPGPAADVWEWLVDDLAARGLASKLAEAAAWLIVRSVVGAAAPPAPALPEVALPDYPWRRDLAAWPDAWRRRWGLLANELADGGLGFPADERAAFDRVTAERAAGASPDGPPPAPTLDQPRLF